MIGTFNRSSVHRSLAGRSNIPASAAALALTFTIAGAVHADSIDLDVLYIGNAGTARAKSFEAFLTDHFASVRVADRDSFDPATVGDADVVLLDWSQRDVDIMNMQSIESPLGDRDAWNKPLVLLGSAGLLIAGPWQTVGSYG